MANVVWLDVIHQPLLKNRDNCDDNIQSISSLSIVVSEMIIILDLAFDFNRNEKFFMQTNQAFI